MPATRSPSSLSTRSTSWNYSNAESFNDDMYSNMTFYDTRPQPFHPHYATLPRNFRNTNTYKKQRILEVLPPYTGTEEVSNDFNHGDSGYSSTGTSSPEPESWHLPPTRQCTLLRHPTNDRRCRSDYYFLQRPSPHNLAHPSIEHGIASDPSNPIISFVCGMQPLSLIPTAENTSTNRKKRRRITNNDFSKSDADPLSYIRDNCENATRALSSHRKLHNCDCDFAYLDNRKRGTGSVWRQGEADQGQIVVSRADLGPARPCKKTWFTGWFVRQHLAYHDRYCACGCFGVKK
ncbi:hypothetical protein E4T48_06563 [Aureobasidium sp. EXF-10727]|nr:hypothetical protein E4T48_06563 [Aureobasidium sp. EXF-10727]